MIARRNGAAFGASVVVFCCVVGTGMRDGVFAAAPQSFSDDLCPDATPAGRRLNEMNARSTPPDNGDLLAANEALIAAYRSCATAFDAETHEHGGDQTIDSVIVGRVYARLSESRALKRAGDYAIQLRSFGDARRAYDRASAVLDEIGGIASASSVMNSGGSVPRLVAESRTLRSGVDAARATLVVTPSPLPRP